MKLVSGVSNFGGCYNMLLYKDCKETRFPGNLPFDAGVELEFCCFESFWD